MSGPPIRPTRRVAITAGVMQQFFDDSGVPSAIRDGKTVYVTGHTGEDDDLTFNPDPEHQIRRTFINLARTLEAAGTGWSEVVQLTSHHVGLRGQADVLLAISREFLAAPAPAWTAVGVTELWDEGSIVEISCIAVIGGPRS